MKKKRKLNKKVIISASLFAIFVLAAIVSIVIVLAASTQQIATNINVAYVVDGVGAKTSASYAIVPAKNSEEIVRKAMLTESSEETIDFLADADQMTAEIAPKEQLQLTTQRRKIVFEYVFENTADSAFSLQLLERPEGTNIKETFLVSATRLSVSDYRTRIIDSTVPAVQQLSDYGQKIYYYIAIEVENGNRTANYEGSFTWVLLNQETIDITLDNGDATGGLSSIKVIPTSKVNGIAMPVINSLPTKADYMFAGYYLGSTKYINELGTSANVANLTNGATLTAQMVQAFTISGGTLQSLTSAGNALDVIVVPETVTTIGANAFANSSATTVYIPNTVTTIEAGAFKDNTHIVTIAIEEAEQTSAYADGGGLTQIKANAFAGTTNLQSIILPKTLTTIGEGAFSGSGIKSIYIPQNVSSIGASAFAGCNSLTVLAVADENTKYSSGSYNCIIENSSNKLIAGVSSSTIPPTVATIGQNAFSGSTNLVRITIPENITVIEPNVFNGCTNLSMVTLGSRQWGISDTADGDLEPIDTKNLATNANNLKSGGAWSGKYLRIVPEYFVYSNNGKTITGLTDAGKTAKTLIVPDGVTSIENEAFQYCEMLTSVSFGENSKLTSIGDYAFEYCSSLTSIEIPSSVTSIGSEAFYNCDSLTSITIPSSVTSIGGWAFSGCEGLTSVTFGENSQLTSIGEWTFEYCTNLTSVIFGENSQLTSIGHYAFESCGLTSIEIPSSVTSIGNGAFYSCSSLASITIPASVTSIGDRAFYGCSSLTSVTFKNTYGWFTADSADATSGTSIDVTDAATNATNLKSSSGAWCSKYLILGEVEYFTYSDSTKTTITGLTDAGKKATILEVPSTVTSISNGAFAANTVIQELTMPYVLGDGTSSANALSKLFGSSNSAIPTTLITITLNGGTKVGNYAFYDCTYIQTINVLDPITSIGDYAFTNCGNAGFIGAYTGEMDFYIDINLCDSITTIGKYAFKNCETLDLDYLPASLTTLGEGAFSYCGRIGGVILPSGVTKIPAYAFDGCSWWFDMVIPATITEIGEYAFRSCGAEFWGEGGGMSEDYKTNISFASGSTCTSIGNGAFSNCEGLLSIEIPSSVTSIGDNAFEYCRSLTSIEIPSSVTSISDMAFYSCSNLTSIEIPGSVTSIGSGAFISTGLTSIEIPSSVTSIGYGAFESCSKLTSVTFKNTNGWWYADSADATSGTSISSSSLANTSTAATYLKSTYSSYYWFRDASDNNTTTVKIYFSDGSEYGTFTTTVANPELKLYYGSDGGDSSRMSLGGVEKINTPVGGFGLSVNNDIDAIDVDDIGRNEAKTLTTGQTYIFYLVWDQEGYNGGGSGAGPIVKDNSQSGNTLTYSATNYGYGFSLSDGTWTSKNNYYNNTQSKVTLTFSGSGEINIYWTVSSEKNCDKFNIWHNDSLILTDASGSNSGNLSVTISNGDTITARYTKDDLYASNSDEGTFTISGATFSGSISDGGGYYEWCNNCEDDANYYTCDWCRSSYCYNCSGYGYYCSEECYNYDINCCSNCGYFTDWHTCDWCGAEYCYNCSGYDEYFCSDECYWVWNGLCKNCGSPYVVTYCEGCGTYMGIYCEWCGPYGAYCSDECASGG